MAALSLEFWIGTAVAFLCLLLGVGATIAVDAKSKGEFYFVVACFATSAIIVTYGIAGWAMAAGWRSHWRVAGAGLLFAITATLTLEAIRWARDRHEKAGIAEVKPSLTADKPPLSSLAITPSLVFVFGAPLGDNDSAQWIMMLKHYGASPAYNCDIIFYDDDRKNIEHEWLVKHPSSPYPPLGLAGESQKRIYIPEASLEGAVGSFRWNPLDPNSQHYTVSISCRDGVFVEKWEVMRVNGVLRSAITIEHGPQWIARNPGLESVVFRYQDPEFIQTSLATKMPKVNKGKVVHPGWKPRHRFEVPAAIIDPNGNVQVVSGIKLPDGSTLTDFGSWNILTKHFGDTKDPSKQP